MAEDRKPGLIGDFLSSEVKLHRLRLLKDEDSDGDWPLIRKLDTRTPCEDTPLKHSTRFSIAFEEDERRSPTEMLVQHKVPSEEL
jgi:hypothetical protein